MGRILGQVLSSAAAPLAPGLGVSGYRLRAIDGTVITHDNPSEHPGWRLHASYDLALGKFDDLQLTSGRQGERFAVAPGDILIADRGFTRALGTGDIAGRGASFILRRGTLAGRLLDAAGKPLHETDIPGLADADQNKPADVQVQLLPSRYRADGSKIHAADYAKLPPVPCRLIIKPLPSDAAKKAACRAARTASRKKQSPGPARIETAKFLTLLTNLPPEPFSADMICQTYRLRWQIEMAFKRLKSLIKLEHYEAINEKLVKTVLYAKLILALLSQNFTAQIIALSPSNSKWQQS